MTKNCCFGAIAMIFAYWLFQASPLGRSVWTPSSAEGIKPSLGNCSGAFAKSDEPRALAAAIAVGQMGYIKYQTLPEDQRAAYQARFKADREEAMKPDAPDIIDECFRQVVAQ